MEYECRFRGDYRHHSRLSIIFDLSVNHFKFPSEKQLILMHREQYESFINVLRKYYFNDAISEK